MSDSVNIQSRVTMVSNSNAFSGNAVRIMNLAKHIPSSRILFSGPRRETGLEGRAFFTHFRNRILSMKEKSVKMLIDDPGIVHCFKTLPTSGIPSLIGKLKRKPLIVDWDDFEGFGGFADQDQFPYNHIADKFEKWIIRRADALTVVSPFLGKKAREMGFDGPVHFIPNGADVEGIKYSFPESDGPLKLLFVGLLHKSSDLDFALKAMEHLDGEEFRLKVIGDGPRREEFEEMARKTGLMNVEFSGMKTPSEVREYLYESDVALLPFVDSISNRSRSPIKLGEYLAAGKPVVTNPVGIMRDVIKNGANGITTECDPGKFSDGIRKLTKKKTRKKISRNARKTAEKLSWRKIAADLSEVYKKTST